MSVRLTELKPGTEGIVSKIRGGRGMLRKLESLGIRNGVTITKISSQLMRGPILVKIGNAQVAIGHGMARHVFVEITK